MGSGVHTLVFGAVSGAASASADLSALCAELARTTGRIVIPQLLTTYAALVSQMTKGALHIAWTPPLVALELEAAGAARPVLCSMREGRTAYHSVLFTSRGSTLRSLRDLENQHVAWVDRESSSGYVVARMKIAAAGLDPSTLFRRESFLRTHAAVARAVLRGEADVGATYLSVDARTNRVVSAGWLDADAAGSDVHVIATAGPIPADAVVLSTKLSPGDADSITDLVRQLGKTARPALKSLIHADSLERVRPAHFEELRQLAAAQPKSR